MARHARIMDRASGTLLETATLLLAAITALTVIARYESDPPRGLASASTALARPTIAPGPAKEPADDAAGDAERQAILRDMLLHD